MLLTQLNTKRIRRVWPPKHHRRHCTNMVTAATAHSLRSHKITPYTMTQMEIQRPSFSKLPSCAR